MTIADRQQGWLGASFHRAFREILAHHAARYGVAVPAYCLMPDHLHAIAAGLSAEDDQQLWVRAVRRALNQQLDPCCLQKQAHDRVLRPTETARDTFAALVHYLCENPVRAGLVERAAEWTYTGASVPALPALDQRSSDFHERWWAYWNSLGD